MTRTLTFVNLMDRWFCDLPEFKDILDLIDCELIGGMDLVIDKLSKGEKIIRVEASTEELEDYDAVLVSNYLDGDIDSYQATVTASDCEQSSYLVWFPLVATIFKDIPEKIYLRYGD